MTFRILPLAALAALAACTSPEREPSDSDPSASPEPAGSPAVSVPSAASSDPIPVAIPKPPVVDPAARRIALAEWRKSDKPETCVPLALKSDGGGAGTARRANFSGGWGVAFDQPGLRSAYGIAGTGYLPQDTESVDKQRARLAAQWPLFRELEHLPSPSFAGYGIEGAKAYPASNPDGRGESSIAYVRIGGQQCDYNVWSKLGRAHLEHLLENLELLPTG